MSFFFTVVGNIVEGGYRGIGGMHPPTSPELPENIFELSTNFF